MVHFQIPATPGNFRARHILPTSHCIRIRGLIQTGLLGSSHQGEISVSGDPSNTSASGLSYMFNFVVS